MAGVEYASQAMALHVALQSQGPATRGYLASLRAVTLHTDRLDLMDGSPGSRRQPVPVMAGLGGDASPVDGGPSPAVTGAGGSGSPGGVVSRRTLTIKAECQHREATRAVYGFALTADDGLLMDGRAVVIFNP